ncbi:chemotaxis protein CheW [Cytophagales bacterium LB-30]|uniref:Chemotaxis protein CheW n=1 Tax=Shiella aurantiaca TaxID=3058365 RepID=A0ABT8F638_9BACT|nr:chemotaxis protein CheW [Shiella aurantiaca]MDN4165915.1 chemotaxis protein CheW [Shiella aurantiaca]
MEVKEKKKKNAESVAEKTYQNQQLIVFRLGQEEYALHIDQVKEVVITPHITRMPQTPSFVRGVANIRGNIIAIIDLEEKFGLSVGLEEPSKQANNFTLVIESEEFKIGVLVKEVPNTLSISEADIEETSNVIHEAGVESGYIKGVAKSGDRLIILIDILKIMSEKEFDMLTRKQALA